MRILIIEDEKKVAGFLKNGLKEEGYAVDDAYDGQAGFDLAVENEYDMIILDLMLPGLDGITLCKKLRDQGNHTPILMLTAREAVKDRVIGLDAGADDYMTKPFAFEELLARVRVILRKRPVTQELKLEIGNLFLDLITHKVKRGGDEIELTTKEYALLEFLMRNAGTIVTRTMISEHVWDINFETFTNVIDVYINYLRNKIDRDHDEKLIHTVRGRGYVLKK
jgi:heavy metal response regulator